VKSATTAGAASDTTARRATSDAKQEEVAEFVCEEDVRSALKAGRTLLVGEKTIITPSARELGEANRVFVQAGWRY
jgi:hypothetical protein